MTTATKLTFEEKYQVLGHKNHQFDGVFITAVKTTGIFCHPSCRARTPKAKNVHFYDTVKEALENGFRPCKICRPMEPAGTTPDFIHNLIAELHKKPDQKISDENLKQKGVEPHTIRRWFKKNYQMTFHSFQRMLRINYAFNQLKKGKSVTQSAFESGYDSLSGFNQSFQSIFGTPASKITDYKQLNILRFSSPIGSLIACASEEGLCYLGFIGQKRMESQFAAIQKELNGVLLPGENQHLKQCKKEIQEYFAGTRTTFSVSLHQIGTDFRKQVWNELLNIPFGKTRSYLQQAQALQKPKAVRAVASANGANKISIIVPCHRVIGSDGSLTGYAGGLHKKSWLLNFEKQNPHPMPSQNANL